ncbi:DUF4760 domain-containing protein [Pseudomonas jessenii]|uniref:hypothetical protein n=1 Tax=Pseudomonas TaxID=286 RepID=UPI001CBAB887|nr:hypothetical protein [Pseudomonas sp. BF-R-30]
MKDKVVWLVCFLLFLAGVVWGKLTFSSDFYKVANIHDLFEIFGAASTVGAVFVALIGLSTWRKQVKASSDHELASELIVAMRRYQQELVKCWYLAESSVEHIKNNTWIGNGGRENHLVRLYEGRLEDVQASRATLETIELKAAELWGLKFELGFFMAYKAESVFCAYIHDYLSLLIDGGFNPVAEERSDKTLTRWEHLVEQGLVDGQSVSDYVDGLYSEIRRQLRRKLIMV